MKGLNLFMYFIRNTEFMSMRNNFTSIFKEENLKKLTMPILLLKPQEDRQVLESWQDKFAGKVNSVRVVNIPDSRHEIFGSGNKTLEGYYREIFGFLGEE